MKSRRVKLKLSAEMLAKILKVKPENIYSWEKGHRPSDPNETKKIKRWLADLHDDEDDVKNDSINSEYQKKYIALLERTIELHEQTIKKLTK